MIPPITLTEPKKIEPKKESHKTMPIEKADSPKINKERAAKENRKQQEHKRKQAAKIRKKYSTSMFDIEL